MKVQSEVEETALRDAIAGGWAVSPNNIWDLPGEEVYPARGGLPCLRGFSHQVRIVPPRLPVNGRAMPQDAWPVCAYVYLYGGGPCVPAQRYESWADFKAACVAAGGISPSGLPAFVNSYFD